MAKFDADDDSMDLESLSAVSDVLAQTESGPHKHTAVVVPDFSLFDPRVVPVMGSRKFACSLTYYEIPLTQTFTTFGYRFGLEKGRRKRIDSALLRLMETGESACLMVFAFVHF